jgi:hypothetical protein
MTAAYARVDQPRKHWPSREEAIMPKYAARVGYLL